MWGGGMVWRGGMVRGYNAMVQWHRTKKQTLT